MNKFASLGVLPIMLLAIAVFGRAANSGPGKADPPTEGTLVVANLRTESLTFINIATGRQEELILPGPPHELVQTNGRLYITLGRANALVEVDPLAPGILRTLLLEGEPHGIALYGENLVVTLDKANEAVVVDRVSFTELRRWPTGDTPHVVAVSANSILVTDSRDNALRQLQPSQLTVATGEQPEGIAIADGFVVTANATSGTLTIANEVDLSDVRTVGIGKLPVRLLAVDGGNVLVSLQGENRVAVVALGTGKVAKRFSVASRPDGLCLAADGKHLAVASNAEGVVELFGTENWAPATTVSLSDGLGACAWLAPGR